MSSYQASLKRRIAAPASVAYSIIADYRDAHQRIIPPKAFQNLIVEEGGTGEGTTIRYDFKMLGKLRHARARVAEPAPGRVLTERDAEGGTLTTFLVEPADAGGACDVTITTEFQIPDGPLAGLWGKLGAWALRRVFVEELALLDAEARRRNRATRGPTAA
jgi:hypothetical protein